MASSYSAIKAQHAVLSAFAPTTSTSLLPYIAFFSLVAFFALTFTFTTLPKSRNPVLEAGTGLLASGLAGLGVVALFCSTGVYV